MKKFTDSKTDKQPHYAGNEVLKNKLYDIVTETLTPSIDGVSENLTISGIDDLVNEFVKIVENANIDSRIEILENIKLETKEEKLDSLMEAFNKVNEETVVSNESDSDDKKSDKDDNSEDEKTSDKKDDKKEDK